MEQTATPLQLAEHNIKVLLVDDQRIVGETIRRMFADISGLEFKFVLDPAAAMSEALAFEPTVILQDLIMPGVEGIDMVRAFRAEPATRSVPLIVLSSKEEAVTKAEAFAAGANDYLVKLPDKLELVARVRYHSAAYILRLERDEAFRALESQQRVIAQELADAAAYVRSLLPDPIHQGNVRADWRFITSSSLGGDSFGYHWLSPQTLAIYLLDVCGHGVGSALLSVSAINTVRNRTLPDTDFRVPSQVLAALNTAFPMSERDGKYFTIWYGVLDTETRELVYASGGHPPAITIAPDGIATPLAASGLIIGAIPDATYRDASIALKPGSSLFVFSDGCYEITAPDNSMMPFTEFVRTLTTHVSNPAALDQTVAASRAWQQRADFDDDFSLIHFRLPG
jgi:sigma-B regulation protein RsbU (phosphoserine phosphatase)